jgi:hypothetical protein
MTELGCGRGPLLAALCHPAAHLDDFPDFLPPPPTADDGELSRSEIKAAELQRIQRPEPALRELHLRRICAVDVDRDALAQAISATAPPSPPTPGRSSSDFSATPDRWEELRVEIFHGSLESYNESLDDTEIFVASEVVEHLDEHVLKKFGPVVLGTYRPRVVVVTTPNYDFNAHFVPSSAEEESQYRIADPTGQTDRVFRDSDHKFEWTAAEFDEWCTRLAKEFDYDVQIGGVGSLDNYLGRRSMFLPHLPSPSTTSSLPFTTLAKRSDPINVEGVADPKKFFATQTALFRRRYTHEPERSPRSPRTAPLPFFGLLNAPDMRHHSLLHTHIHPITSAHAGRPCSYRKIRRALARAMEDTIQSARVPLWEIWGIASLRHICGGYVGKIVEAILNEGGDEWDFEVDETKRGTDAVVVVYKPSALAGPREAGDDGGCASNGGVPAYWSHERGDNNTESGYASAWTYVEHIRARP